MGSSWEDEGPQVDPYSEPPDDFSNMRFDEAIQRIKHWFLNNFEDPANQTPRDGEGGYEYIWGGPYDVFDIVSNVFADSASEDLINAAVKEIEKRGIEWVPHGRRIRAADDSDSDIDEVDAVAAYRNVQASLSRLTALLAEIKVPPGLGHNMPPDGNDVEASLSERDKEELSQAIFDLRDQPVFPESNLARINTASTTIKKFADKLLKYSTSKTDLFLTKAIESAGTEVGKRGVQVSILAALADELIDCVRWLSEWLKFLPAGF